MPVCPGSRHEKNVGRYATDGRHQEDLKNPQRTEVVDLSSRSDRRGSPRLAGSLKNSCQQAAKAVCSISKPEVESDLSHCAKETATPRRNQAQCSTR